MLGRIDLTKSICKLSLLCVAHYRMLCTSLAAGTVAKADSITASSTFAFIYTYVRNDDVFGVMLRN